MKKYLFLSALFCTALGMNAQWPTSYEGEPVQMTPDLQDYGDETVTNCHGVTFNVQYVAQHGTAGVDDMEYVISIVDKDGHNVTTLDKGMGLGVFQNRSWTAYNNTLYCDRDGNLLVGANDCRNNPEPKTAAVGYTLYKISEKGEILWQVDLADKAVYPITTSFGIAQDGAGDYICCYTAPDVNAPGNYTYIEMEKISKDGKSLWRTKLNDPDFNYIYNYPYLVEGPEGDVVMVYAYGSNQDLYASRISTEDGSQVWKTRFYRSGFATTGSAIWNYVRVCSDGKGGVFTLWMDDRANDGYWQAYVNYVDAEGKIAYPNKMNGVKVAYNSEDYAGYSHSNMSFCHSEKEQCVYVGLRHYDTGGGSYNGILVQKISDEGELLWPAEGIFVETTVKNLAVANPQPQPAPDGGCVVFYQTGNGMSQYGGKNNCAAKYGPDGTKEWSMKTDHYFTYKTNLRSSGLIDDSYWVINWEDQRKLPFSTAGCFPRYAARINADGTFGNTEGIQSTSLTTYEGAQYYDVTGKQLLAPAKGLNIVKTPAGVKKQVMQ